MAKPKKEKEEMLESPAGSAVETEAPIRQDWPEATETRELNVSLSDDQIIEQSRILIDDLREVENLSAAKKASADNYKSRIEEVEKRIEDVSIVVKSGKDRRVVHCRWIFQANGFDSEGLSIYHSELKTLVRSDTDEVVEIKPITFDDRQINLPLDTEETFERNMKAITDAGFTLRETEDDELTSAAFVLVDQFGVAAAVDGDSKAEAAALAQFMLPDIMPTETETAEPCAE